MPTPVGIPRRTYLIIYSAQATAAPKPPHGADKPKRTPVDAANRHICFKNMRI